jgi:hypothetical protein
MNLDNTFFSFYSQYDCEQFSTPEIKEEIDDLATRVATHFGYHKENTDDFEMVEDYSGVGRVT